MTSANWMRRKKAMRAILLTFDVEMLKILSTTFFSVIGEKPAPRIVENYNSTPTIRCSLNVNF